MIGKLSVPSWAIVAGFLLLAAIGLASRWEAISPAASDGKDPSHSSVRHLQEHDHQDHSHHHHGHVHKTPCKTQSPPASVVFANEAVLQGRKRRRERRTQVETCDSLCNQCIDIGVYVHFMELFDDDFGAFIPHPTFNVQIYDNPGPANPPGSLTADDFTSVEDMLLLVDDQITYLNNKFAPTPFRFTLLEPDSPSRTSSQESWTRFAFDNYEEMSAALHRGGTTDLNLYLMYGAGEDLGDGSDDGTLGFVGGFANAQLENNGDGIFVRYDNLPNGGGSPYDFGETVVHEAGHWLGLLHTFDTTANTNDDPCDPSNLGDMISDTPAQSQATIFVDGADCREVIAGNSVIDTCPADEEPDPVLNYMNYVRFDSCFATDGEFTCGQIERMYRHWAFFRDYVSNCASGEMEIELAVDFDRFYYENTFYVKVENGDTVFNSTTAVDYDRFSWEDRVMVVDLCVPNNQNYEFTFIDSNNDGLESDGFYDIFRDGELISRLEGTALPNPTVVLIPATNAVAATDSPTTSPTVSPTVAPTSSPTASPNVLPATESPTLSPTSSPTASPTASPNVLPTTESPTSSPTSSPTASPNVLPTTESPTSSPTSSPTESPNTTPTTEPPTAAPSTAAPTTSFPSLSPTTLPPSTGAPTEKPTDVRASVLQIFEAGSSLARMNDAFSRANLNALFGSQVSYTVFAPNNSAFILFAITYPQLNNVLFTAPWLLHLQEIMMFHMMTGIKKSTDFVNGESLTALNGEQVSVELGSVILRPAVGGSSTVIVPDQIGADGIVHTVSAVLTPTFVGLNIIAVARNEASLFAGLVVQANMESTINAFGMTVFAPRNSAVMALGQYLLNFLRSWRGKGALEKLVRNHAVAQVLPSSSIPNGVSFSSTVSGRPLRILKNGLSTVKVNRARVLDTDILASNGIVHMVDIVLFPGSIQPHSNPPPKSSPNEFVPTPTPPSLPSFFSPGGIFAPAPAPAPVPVPVPVPVPAPAPVPVPVPVPAPVPNPNLPSFFSPGGIFTPAPAPAPVPVPSQPSWPPDHAPVPVPVPVPVPAPAPVPVPVPVPAPVPNPSLPSFFSPGGIFTPASAPAPVPVPSQPSWPSRPSRPSWPSWPSGPSKPIWQGGFFG
eukprot:CAMPEP_0172471002 /NCGR_PEP_ID=MMETSP1065-20121228/67592_1 /TAXON_ID=265537 /ORGANISM="Amphiprora paludosa, Strain CCMP125" /LENGTH=1120 /DNA_ID=CAMNT_0013229085 /DNA_START=20 /DNA_END=3383 /DNA_ORIENTATION=+